MPTPCAPFQPKLLDVHELRPRPVFPRDGESFSLAELYEHLHCTTIEVVNLGPELILLIDEEGLG